MALCGNNNNNSTPQGFNALQAMKDADKLKIQTMPGSQTIDPLYGPEAQRLRADIYAKGGQAYANANRANSQMLNAAEGAYSDPYWQQAMNKLNTLDPNIGASNQLVSQTLAGDFLRNPAELNASLAQIQGRADRGAADQNAILGSKMARAGVGLSSADMQGQEANAAASRADAQANASQITAANYANERNNQANAVGQSTALRDQQVAELAAQGNMLQQRAGLFNGIGAQMMQPINSYADLLRLSQGQQQTIDNVQLPTTLDYALQAGSMTPEAASSFWAAMSGKSNPQQSNPYTTDQFGGGGGTYQRSPAQQRQQGRGNPMGFNN